MVSIPLLRSLDNGDVASDVCGSPLDCEHYIAEEAPTRCSPKHCALPDQIVP